MTLRGVLLDVDGTLLLSNHANAQSWHDAYAEFGYDIPVSTFDPLIGMGGDQLMQKVTPDVPSDSEAGKKISERREEIFLERYLPDLHSHAWRARTRGTFP